MAFGVDYSEGYDIASLKSANTTFACRYIGFTSNSLPQTKIITYSESYDLAKAGIDVVSNYEWTGDRASIHNGFYNGNATAAFNGGEDDAARAKVLHQSIGGPSTKPIYFSVDFSTDGTDCVDYFKGLVSVLGVSRVGAYGPYSAIKYLKENNLIAWCWQTYAWSGGLWYSGNHIEQYNNGVTMGNMVVDFDRSKTTDFGQWTLPTNAPSPKWYQYPICVPFGNPQFDSGVGGSHDLDVGPPPNMEVHSIVSGVVSDLSAPSWGKQVGILLDTPVNGIRWFHYLHLSAINPKLTANGQRVNVGDLIGWVGGANTASQYLNTTNPTGQNFINDPNQSSRVQLGIALMDGPAYGGPGWVNFPPIDYGLDPTSVLKNARNKFMVVSGPDYKQLQFDNFWLQGHGTHTDGTPWVAKKSGIYQVCVNAHTLGKMSAAMPLTDEFSSQDWHGNSTLCQLLSNGCYVMWYGSIDTSHVYNSVDSQIL
jgi:hypothetical protein